MANGLKWTPSEIKGLDEGEWRIVVLQKFDGLQDSFKEHCVEAEVRSSHILKAERKISILEKISYVAMILIPGELAVLGWLILQFVGHIAK